MRQGGRVSGTVEGGQGWVGTWHRACSPLPFRPWHPLSQLCSQLCSQRSVAQRGAPNLPELRRQLLHHRLEELAHRVALAHRHRAAVPRACVRGQCGRAEAGGLRGAAACKHPAGGPPLPLLLSSQHSPSTHPPTVVVRVDDFQGLGLDGCGAQRVLGLRCGKGGRGLAESGGARAAGSTASALLCTTHAPLKHSPPPPPPPHTLQPHPP